MRRKQVVLWDIKGELLADYGLTNEIYTHITQKS